VLVSLFALGCNFESQLSSTTNLTDDSTTIRPINDFSSTNQHSSSDVSNRDGWYDISEVEPHVDLLEQDHLEGPIASEPPTMPEFPHLESIIDTFRGSIPVWLQFVYVDYWEDNPRFQWLEYAETGHQVDYWPASTIKIYTATAALELLYEYGVSLDAEATFYHRSDETDAWTEDLTTTFRQMIFNVFDYSSNTDYTLLLRFAGIDWLNGSFLTPENGFQESALLVGYYDARPWGYIQTEQQRIVIEEGDLTFERTHTWSGETYDVDAGCSVYYGSLANCSSPRDMVEHMRRLIFHEFLPEDERFLLEQTELDWLRYGDDEPVLNDWESDWATGIFNVLPNADYYHKAGAVTAYYLDLHYVDDLESDTHYLAAIVTEAYNDLTYTKISEEIARMALTPHAYVHLDFLTDYVNPVTAETMVYAESSGTLDLVVKEYSGNGYDMDGWTSLTGTEQEIEAGLNWYSIQSGCLDVDEQVHIRGRFIPHDGRDVAYSDLHYVIVDADVTCF
jgi:hypothetical protein